MGMTQGNSSDVPTSETLLNNPQYFLHKIDTTSSQLIFLETTRERLSALPFIDGRAALSPTEQSYSAKIQGALDWQPVDAHQNRSDRLIFHVSFCGSTLLARACEVPNKTLALKEPRVLLDLATIKAHRMRFYTDQKLWSRLVKFTLGQLRKPWSAGEIPIVKLSNWSNTILVDLFRHGLNPRVILLSMDLRSFLIAVLRGGRERIVYTCRLLAHLQAEDREFRQLVERAAPIGSDPMESAIRLSALAHHGQIRIFDQALAMKSIHCAHCMSYEELVQRPAEAVSEVSRALNLDLSEQDIGLALDRTTIRHAKDPERSFDHNRARQINRQVEKQYGQMIDRTIDWYQSRVSL